MSETEGPGSGDALDAESFLSVDSSATPEPAAGMGPPASSFREALVDDRELAAGGVDRFRHVDVVAQVCELVEVAEPPMNIALYGPWGSGKSSLANQLEASLRGSRARFVRYDAFKYARTPLHRNFISQLASVLSVNDRKFGAGLYEDTQSDDLSFSDLEGKKPLRSVWDLAWVVLVVLGVGLLVAISLTALAALIGSSISESESFASTFAAYMKNHLAAYLAPAALLGIFGAIATKKLTVSRGMKAPSSEEQFADIFSDLVQSALSDNKSKGVDRLVIFIDELDRCDGDTVVETLASLRTFLDAPQCIFIVAADQQVLETALSEHVRQATPVDLTNPYYSAGSEYLDKTFHFQLSLPPLHSRRLSAFAAELVADKPGVWSELPSVGRVVSVLIPNHVRSPRRVKTLLNSFAFTYDIVRRRSAANVLSGSAAERADEIALLTALRVEFPLFARELSANPLLVQAFRAVADGGDNAGNEFDEDLWTLATRFVTGRAPSDILLASDPLSPNGAEAPAAEVDELPASDQEVDDVEVTEMPTEGNWTPALRAAQSRLLRAYLQKTRAIDGPQRDLIHLEGIGATYGLDPAATEALENAASNGEFDQVLELAAKFGEDGDVYVLKSLAENLDREEPIGVEADNILSTILRLYGRYRVVHGADADFPETASVIGAAVRGTIAEYSLQDDDLVGALGLGLDLGAEGSQLVHRVLTSPDGQANRGFQTTLVDNFSDLAAHSEAVGKIVGTGLSDTSMGHHVASRIAALGIPTSASLLDMCVGSITAILHAEFSELDADGDLDDDERRSTAADRASELLGLFEEVPLRQRVAAAILGADHVGARDAVLPLLPRLADTPDGRISYPTLVERTLRALPRRTASSMLSALRALDYAALDVPVRQQRADVLAGRVWDAAEKGGELSSLTDVLREIGALAGEQLPPTCEYAVRAAASLVTPATGAEAAEGLPVLGALAALGATGVVSYEDVIDGLAAHAVECLNSALAAPEPTPDLFTWAASASTLVAQYGSEQAINDLHASVVSSPWMTVEHQTQLELHLVAGTASPELAVEFGTDLDRVVALASSDPTMRDLAAQWLVVRAPEPDLALPLLEVLSDPRPAEEVLNRVRQYRLDLEPEDQRRLLTSELDRSLEEAPRFDILDAVGLSDLPDSVVAEELVRIYGAVTRMEQRRRILELWEHARIADDRARSRLLLEVMIPVAESGKQGVDLLVRHIELCRNPPRGTSMRIQAIRMNVDQSQRHLVEDAFVKVDLGSSRRRWLRSEYRENPESGS